LAGDIETKTPAISSDPAFWAGSLVKSVTSISSSPDLIIIGDLGYEMV
jgi:hypothetical protein